MGKPKIIIDSKKQEIKILNKIHKFSDIVSYQIFASGVATNEQDLVKRLNSKENYLAYKSFTSLWIEIKLVDDKKEKIVFYKTPIVAGESDRKKYVSEVLEISDILNNVLEG